MQKRAAIALLFALGITSTVRADSESERTVLARVIHELESLQLLLAEAEREADPDARIHFRYDWLRQDLERVSEGIDAHLRASRTLPRPIQPLRGDYRH